MVGPGAVVRASRLTKRSACAALFFLFWTIPAGVHAQRGRGQAAANVPAKASAPIDLTGYWVSLVRSEEHTSELQSLTNLVCRLLLEKKKKKKKHTNTQTCTTCNIPDT